MRNPFRRATVTPDPVMILLEDIQAKQNTTNEKVDTVMSALDDLTAATDALGNEIVTFLQDIQAEIAGGVTATDAEALVARIAGFTAQLQGADPTPPPAPAPSA